MRTITSRACAGAFAAALAATGCNSTSPFAKQAQPLNMTKTPNVAPAPNGNAALAKGWTNPPAGATNRAPGLNPNNTQPVSPIVQAGASQLVPQPSTTGMPTPSAGMNGVNTGVQPAGYNAPAGQAPAVMTANSVTPTNPLPPMPPAGARPAETTTRNSMPVPAPTTLENTPAANGPPLPQPVPPSLDVPPAPPPMPAMQNMPAPTPTPAAAAQKGAAPMPPSAGVPTPVTLPPVRLRPQE
jgi:hypothetical protein